MMQWLRQDSRTKCKSNNGKPKLADKERQVEKLSTFLNTENGPQRVKAFTKDSLAHKEAGLNTQDNGGDNYTQVRHGRVMDSKL